MNLNIINYENYDPSNQLITLSVIPSFAKYSKKIIVKVVSSTAYRCKKTSRTCVSNADRRTDHMLKLFNLKVRVFTQEREMFS